MNFPIIYFSDLFFLPDRAPELFHIETNASFTSKTDIFSLGGILYACCFGKGPFDDVYSRGDRYSIPFLSQNYIFDPLVFH